MRLLALALVQPINVKQEIVITFRYVFVNLYWDTHLFLLHETY